MTNWKEFDAAHGRDEGFNKPRKVPDRVIDAPIADYEIVKRELDRRLDGILVQLKDGVRVPLKDYLMTRSEHERVVARLEAEKQEAYTEGWNAAIEKVIKRMKGAASSMWGVPKETTDWLCGIICRLRKPTAAKQGDPS